MIKKIPVGVIMQTNCYIVYDKDTKENLKNKVEIYGSVNTHKYGVYKIHYVVYSSHNIKAEKIGQVIVK